MAQELQGLLERIQNEGIKRADSEKERIVSDARAEADRIVREAREEAEALRKKAADDAAALQSRTEAAIRQAARDIVLSLKEDLKKRLQKVVGASVNSAMTPEFMQKLILAVAGNSSANAGIKVLTSAEDAAKLVELCAGGIAADLKQRPVIAVGGDFDSGLKIGFEGGDVFFDFTDEALTGIVCEFAGPRIAALLEDK